MKTRILNKVVLAATFVTVAVVPLVRAEHNAHLYGEWGPVLPLPFAPVHGVLLKTGKVLACSVGSSAEEPNRCLLFDPQTDTVVGEFDGPKFGDEIHNLFSSGHTQLPDGRILFVGGIRSGSPPQFGNNQATIFDPAVDPPGADFSMWKPGQRWSSMGICGNG